jgi:hypothetical protein
LTFRHKRGAGVEAPAVILYAQGYGAIFVLKRNAHVIGMTVLGDIVETFL